MAKAEELRFVKIYSQGSMFQTTEIWLDTQTGVQYLFRGCGNAGGLTPLLDHTGRQAVTAASPAWSAAQRAASGNQSKE